MHVAVFATDKPGMAETRLAARPAHLEYLKSLGPKIVIGGPLLDPAGEIMSGSLVVFDVADEAEARALLAGDPYSKAGIFETVTVRPWRWTIGRPDAA